MFGGKLEAGGKLPPLIYAYKTMQQRWRKYYAKEKMPIGEEYEFDKEFEIWARMIKDHRGDDIQMFIKKDEKNKFRKDSSFYYDGYWEVFEFDDALRETRFRTASGVRSVSKYDIINRLKEYYRMEGNDTLESQKYEWENGRLVRMTANGVVRNYFYGKTLRDPVRVEPSDEGFNYHRGYNGTAGKIPEEGTDDYEIFSRDPYGHVHFGEIEEEEYEQDNISFASKKTSGSLNVLASVTTIGCVNKRDGFPGARCIRFTIDDALKNATSDAILNGYPSYKGKPKYGFSDYELSVDSRCYCNSETGKYKASHVGSTINEVIGVYQNFWKFNSGNRSWQEVCWGVPSLGITYSHEIEHVKNARRAAANATSYSLKFDFDTKKECEANAKYEYDIFKDKWKEWYRLEQDHRNPSSPTYSGDRYQYDCN
jgi:hypothetical protein